MQQTYGQAGYTIKLPSTITNTVGPYHPQGSCDFSSSVVSGIATAAPTTTMSVATSNSEGVSASYIGSAHTHAVTLTANTVFEEYVVETGNSISVNDVVSTDANGLLTKGFGFAAKNSWNQNDVSLLAMTTMSLDGTGGGTFVIAYNDNTSLTGYAVAFTVTSGVFAFGTPVTFNGTLPVTAHVDIAAL